MRTDSEYNRRFALCYYKHKDGYLPNGVEETPNEDSGSNLNEMLQRAERVWKARKKNGYQLIELWDGTGEEWEIRQTWPEDAIDRLYD